MVIGGPIFAVVVGSISALVVKKNMKEKEKRKLKKLSEARAYCQQNVNN